MSPSAPTERDPRERFFEQFAEDFDAAMNRYDLERRLDLVETALRPVAGTDAGARPLLLDAGSGTGWFSRRAVALGFEVVALDLGPQLLRQVRAKCDVRCVAGSILELPFETGRFDAVLSSEVIEHTPDPLAAVHEIARVLRPGGLLVLTCPNRAWHWSVRLANRLGIRPYEGLENWPRYGALAQSAREAGLEIERHFGFHALPFQLPRAPRWLPVLDRWLRFASRWMINQGLVARRVGAPTSAEHPPKRKGDSSGRSRSENPAS